ncbi:MAG: hypothetical protein E7449_06560 [Ruminococcaceae bacterium]|nr:hypothetical protein [Oscillospiraceae bacterium]
MQADTTREHTFCRTFCGIQTHNEKRKPFFLVLLFLLLSLCLGSCAKQRDPYLDALNYAEKNATSVSIQLSEDELVTKPAKVARNLAQTIRNSLHATTVDNASIAGGTSYMFTFFEGTNPILIASYHIQGHTVLLQLPDDTFVSDDYLIRSNRQNYSCKDSVGALHAACIRLVTEE